MSGCGTACVKTCASRECAELFSPFSCFDCDCQCCSFLFNVIETNFLRASSTLEFSHRLDTKRTSLAGSVMSGPGSRTEVGFRGRQDRF